MGADNSKEGSVREAPPGRELTPPAAKSAINQPAASDGEKIVIPVRKNRRPKKEAEKIESKVSPIKTLPKIEAKESVRSSWDDPPESPQEDNVFRLTSPEEPFDDMDSLFDIDEENSLKKNKDVKIHVKKSETAFSSPHVVPPVPDISDLPDNVTVFYKKSYEQRALENTLDNRLTSEAPRPTTKRREDLRDLRKRSPRSDLPESYAQKQQRQMYMRDDEALLRQKTIYRDPDEWEPEQKPEVRFDIDRFKAANLYKAGDMKGFQTLASYITADDVQRENSEIIIPSYDASEEDLMADIEKEFGL